MDFELLPPDLVVVDLSDKINAFHQKVRGFEKQSKDALGAALLAAWEAGRLLNEQKSNIEDGNWGVWLKCRFQGNARTAQRYMQLAKSIPDESHLNGMSIRQAYQKCGISTSGPSKGPVEDVDKRCIVLPSYLFNLKQLNRWAQEKGDPRGLQESEIKALRSEFHLLYQWLSTVFSSKTEVDQLTNGNK